MMAFQEDISSEQLTKLILDPFVKNDQVLWDHILLAEDTGFSLEESKKLSPWLLNFALTNRDQDEHETKFVGPAVWSAIRTGASMLSSDKADRLASLLEPSSFIDTRLVALKMIGRIFEVQSPTKSFRRNRLSRKIEQIAYLMLNPKVLILKGASPIAIEAIFALAAMGSKQTIKIIEEIPGKNFSWLRNRLDNKFYNLNSHWRKRNASPKILLFLSEIRTALSKSHVDPVKKRKIFK